MADAVIDKIAYLPIENFDSVIFPKGKSRASSLAADVQKEFEGILPYGVPLCEMGIYGRVLAKYPSPTIKGKELVQLTTYSQNPEWPEDNFEPHVLLIEVDKLEFIEDETKLDALKTLFGTESLAKKAPVSPPPKPKTRKEIYDEMLDAVVGKERYDWVSPIELYIHYPEFTIRNTHDNTHVIRDLYVKLTFVDSALLRLNRTIEGMRTTLSEAELRKHYGHSHLQSSGYRTFATFCLGATSLAELVTDFMTTDIDPDQFFILIMWIGEYLQWESLEGGPYHLMGDVTRINNSSTSSVNVVVPYNNTTLWTVLTRFIASLTPNDLANVSRPDGTTLWLLDLSLAEKFQEDITRLWQIYGARTLLYDKTSGTYISNGSTDFDLQNEILRYTHTSGRIKFKEKYVDFKVVRRNQEEVKHDLIHLAPPNAIADILFFTNLLLNKPKEAYSFV